MSANAPLPADRAQSVPPQGTSRFRRLIPLVVVLLVVLATYGIVAASRVWLLQTVAGLGSSHESVTGSALALDADGRVHAVYASSVDGLVSLTQASGGWSRSTVTPTVGYAPSIVLDSSGGEHIMFSVDGAWNSSHPGPNLMYATDAGGVWNVSYVAYGVGTGSIALDPQGGIHVAYARYANCTLQYASLLGKVWNETTAFGSSYCNEYWGLSVSLVIGSDGTPHVAYATSTTVGFAVRQGGTWSAQPLLSANLVLAGPTLVLDHEGQPHIAVIFGTDLLHLFERGGAWVNESIDHVVSPLPLSSEIGIDSAGSVHVVYGDRSRGLVVHATEHGSTWSPSIIDTGAIAQSLSATVGPGDRIQVLYDRFSLNASPSSAYDHALIYATDSVDLTNLSEFVAAGLLWAGLAAVAAVVVLFVVLPRMRGRGRTD